MSKAAALQARLRAKGVEWPAAIEWHAVVASTNDRLKSLAREAAPEWTVVISDRQTRGRGRDGRAWTSPAGGLYLSVLLRPRFSILGLLPLAAGVAVAEAVEEQGVRAALKWPNDVLVEDAAPAAPAAPREAGDPRKLAGILAEAASGIPGLEWVVLGIGVNVSRAEPGAPQAQEARMAWIAESSPHVELGAVAAAVLARLRVWYDALGSSPASVVEAWRRRSVAWWGQPVELRAGMEALRGTLVDVDAEGALVIETAEGARRRLVSGEVTRLRRES